ncbi:hypothetical protein [Paenibacillus tyrfis]|uniref:Uncharacterized protein n=1 Tax=Paenibacillus tyrfis TaxID=1501230 RepID=A0A081NYI8_9BACL|nr:hypothetical protein [Paenibacillus tyrfis]KEQ23511.1 hypothetical protein ET33_15365 [Paenibacillus tyrfis]
MKRSGIAPKIIGMIALNAQQTAAKSGDVFNAIQMTEEAALQGNQAIHTSNYHRPTYCLGKRRRRQS